MTATLVRRRRSHDWRALAASLFLATASTRALSQLPSSPRWIDLNTEAEERIRLDQLLGRSTGDAFLIRSVSRLSASVDSSLHPTSSKIGVLMPELRMVRNSGVPFSLNDGPLWAGRGWSESVTSGIEWRNNRVRLIVAPTFVLEQNAAFQVVPFPQNATPPRNVWANPFHPLPESIDLPIRFGDRQIAHGDLGQTSLTVDAGGASIGVGTENLWWGPGIRNAITLSNNASGFPHLLVQTRAPVHTSVGTFDAQWFIGQLSESGFFDNDSSNDKRALTGVVATWATPFDSTLTIGMARLAVATQRGSAFPLGHAFDVLRSSGHVNTELDTPVPSTGRDQITSFFARWLLVPAGFEAYAEWARFEEPKSLRDFLEYPEHSEAYTLGIQWARALGAQRTFQLQSEFSYLEPDPSIRLRPVSATYASRGVPQGFTQRGQVLGAAIGPGASSQWLAGDLFMPRRRVGLYLSRIRWDNDALFEEIVPGFKRQDVTLSAGLRGSATWNGVNVMLDFAHATRFNYLFQSYQLGPNRFGGIDLVNNTLTLTLSSAPWR